MTYKWCYRPCNGHWLVEKLYDFGGATVLLPTRAKAWDFIKRQQEAEAC